MFNENHLKQIELTFENICFVNEITINAGQIAKKKYEEGLLRIDEKEGPDDLVTQVDQELSDLLISRLKQRFPEDGIISEEEKPDNSWLKGSKCWVIDPIDGTNHYVSNNGQYSVMIGLLKDNKPVAGWVYSPIWDKLVIGIPENGLYETNSKLHISKIISNKTLKDNKQSLKLMIGSRDRKKNPELADRLRKYEIVEMGSLGLKVILIIEKKADLFIHTMHKLKLWDTVAPSALALAADLHISTLEGDSFIFSPEQLTHFQTYAVGHKWAFDEITPLLKN